MAEFELGPGHFARPPFLLSFLVQKAIFGGFVSEDF
jgi:hypothetical protein